MRGSVLTQVSRARRVLFGAASITAMLVAAPSAWAQAAAQGAPTTSQGTSNTAGPEAQRVPGTGAAQEGGAASDAPLAASASPDAEIVVLGVRGAQRAAINVKRSAPQIVDSIVAEDIGKLPDNTIADSLQRVPGVQITRDAGEGAGVNIRGIPQVLTTINGELFLSAGVPPLQGGQSTAVGTLGNSAANFGDVPPSLFAGVDVIKSPTADQLSGGIAGILALKTRRPLDLERGVNATLSGQGDLGLSSKDPGQAYNGLLSYNHENRWGALLGFSYTQEHLANYNPNTSYAFNQITDQQVGYDLRKDGKIGNSVAVDSKDFYFQPQGFGLNNQTTDRERAAVFASAQYKITDALTATFDADYLHLDNRDRAVEGELGLNNSGTVLQPGALISPNGGLLNGTYNVAPPPGPDGLFQTHSYSGLTTSNTTNFNFQLDYNNHGPLRASLRYAGAVSEQSFSSADTDSLATQRIFKPGVIINPNGVPSAQVGINLQGDAPAVNFITDLSNPANYSAQSIWANGNNLNANINTVRGDVSYDVNFGPLRTLEVGARYSQRNVKFDAFKYETPIGGDGLNNLYYYKDGLIGDPNYGGASIVPRRPFSSIPGLVTQVTDFGPITGIPAGGLPAIDPKKMDNALGYLNGLFPQGSSAYSDPTANFRVQEKETSGYVKADFGGTLPFLPFTYSGNVGVRVVGTTLDIRNFRTDSNQYIGAGGSYNGVLVNLGEINSSKSYVDPLPELNLSIDVTETQKARFAFNRAVARQNLPTLASGFVSSYIANSGRNPNLPPDAQLFLAGSSGNPNLDPFRANIVQGSYEWYFHKSSLLSAAAFYVDVESFNLQSTLILTGPQEADADGVTRAGGPVTTTVNGGGGSIKGVELGYQQAFDFLPGWLSGFGVQANYTYSDSSTDNRDQTGSKLPLPDNSKHQVNGVLLYQKGPFQARAAYNFRSTQYNQQYGVQNLNLGIYTKPVGFLDASASYDINPHVTIFAQGNNITGSGIDRYLQYGDVYYSQSIFESRVVFGIRLRN